MQIEGYPEYQDYLEVHQDEFTALFNTILINVTAFFRDSEAWDYLRAEGGALLNLDIGLPVDRHRPLVRRALSGDAATDELVLQAVNRRGRPVSVRVVCSPLASVGEPSGAIIAMEAGEFAPGRGGHP